MSYQDVKDKLYHGHRKIANNTYLTLEEYYLGDNAEAPAECIDMRLHGHVVASFHKECLHLYSAGWHIKTTKNRLNKAIDIALINSNSGSPNWLSIYQVDYQWYYGYYRTTDPKFYDGMRIDYTGKVIN